MKGFIIYESPCNEGVVWSQRVNNGWVYRKENVGDIPEICIEGEKTERGIKATCSPDDTYDFETGALIALMKMCGVEKVVRACNEAFSEDTFKTYATKYERELNELKKDSDKIIDKLIEENEKLKLDCEKLQHGYNDMIFCGGRQNGKQYTALVNMFKKLDQKKVDAAYKEAYNTELPVWQNEVLKQMYDIQIWLRPLTKREKMWNDIRNSKVASCIEVDRADVIDFLEDIEKEIPEVHCSTGAKPTAIKPMFDYKYAAECNKVYFFVGEDRITFGFDKETSREKVQYVTYLPPMRWDLFKKGRLAVKVNYDNYKEFYDACEKELGKRPLTMFPYTYTVSICKKDGNFQIFTMEDQKKTGRKIVDWEDVR